MTSQIYDASYARDRAEIDDLLARYLFAMDYNDFDTYGETFTEDGTLEFARGAVTGRDNIKAAAKGFKEAIAGIYVDVDGRPAVLRHILCHSAIRVEGDRAWHTGMWFETANDGPRNEAGRLTPTWGTFGIYEDELRRVDGAWMFSYRNIRNEFLAGRESGPDNPVLAMDRKAEMP